MPKPTMVTPLAARSLHLIIRCLAILVITDVADRDSAGVRHWLELGCGLLALLWPSTITLLVLAAICLGVSFVEPFTSWYVHHYVAATLHAVVCASVLLVVVTKRRMPMEPELLELIRTPFRWVAFAVVFAGLAKLNRDFLDPRISCGGVYYLWAQEWPGLRVLPDTNGAKSAVIALTLGGELLGPLLLLARRTRAVGLALLWFLTLGLCANTRAIYVEFIGLFWVASLLWLDPRVLDGAAELLARVSQRLGAPLGVKLKIAAALAIAVLIELGRGRHDAVPLIYLWLSAGLAMVLAVTAAVLLSARMSHTTPEAADPPVLSRRLRMILLIMPLAMLCNEARLYLGWPSKPTLTMAANFVITEHETNHLLLSRIPHLAFGGAWGITIEPPYRMRKRPALCGKAEPGLSLNDSRRRMQKRLAAERVAGED
jgi:hypothetical protein